MTHKNRPIVMAWCSLFMGFSMAFTSIVAWIILSFDFNIPIHGEFIYRPWRLIPIIYTIPGYTAEIILIFFKESPRYLLAQGKDDEALKVLYWMWIKNTGTDIDAYSVKKLVSEVDYVAKMNTENQGYLNI